MLSLSSLVTVLLPLVSQVPSPPADALRTVAERTEYKATARHADVVALCRELAKSSPNAHYTELGKSVEGRPLPLLILADPPVKSPADAARDGRLVVFVIGDIHGGEVCGKEALPMLARELLSAPHHPILKNVIVAFAPIINADGNERVSKTNRPGQVGPEEGMGERGNARGLDLNRDFIKLEAPETRAIVGFFNTWKPHLFIDTHTTNGSHHRYTITYEGPRNPNGDAGVIEYSRYRFIPALDAAFEKATGLRAYYYGNFDGDHTHWTSFPAEGRYSTNYFGLRNRIGILSEAYAHAPYKTRVLATRDFVREALNIASSHKDEIRKVLDDAETKVVAAGKSPRDDDRVSIRTEPRPLHSSEPILGYVETYENGKRVRTDEPKDYPAAVMNEFSIAETVARPFAYLIPADRGQAIETLQRHGLDVEELREDLDLDVEAYRIDEVGKPAGTSWDRQDVVDLRVTPRKETRRIPAGTRVVKTSQPLGDLAVYLLEPRSEDGLATWKQFDGLKAAADFPVVRLPKPAPLLTTAAEPLAETRKRDLPITFELAGGHRGGGWFSGAPVAVNWLDEEHWLRRHDGAVLKVEARTGRSEPFITSDQLLQSLRRIKGLDDATASGLARRLLGEIDPARKGLVFQHDHDLYYIALDGSAGARLTDHPGEETLARFSPDGRQVAFVRDHDLYAVDVADPKERALTTGGRDTLRHGEADWVYFEEIFNRSWSAFWWSPDSKKIAFMEFEDAEVGTLTMLDDTESPRKVEVNKYPRAGEPNPRVKLGVVGSQGGPIAWADLSEYSAEAFLISDVGWWPDSSAVYSYVQNRVQTWLDLLKIPVADALSKPQRLFRDATKAWIADQPPITFLKDGSFLWLSERDGWKHIYHYAADGGLKQRITEGPWEVRAIQHVDADSGWITFTGTKDAPMATQLYRVKPGGPVERLTSGTGSYQTEFSPKGRYYLATWSDLTTPSQSKLFTADGRFVRTIDTNPVYKLKEYRFGARERLQIPARDGFVLEAELILPPNFDANKKYPVWFTTYGGPHTPTVTDTWTGGRLWEQALAGEGFIVFRADPRPASGKGAVSAWTAYKKLGVQELEDIKDAIGWLKRKPYVDGGRIGMTGHSYGGYMTAFAMTHSDLFAAGIAGAPVTDWHDYDTIYTERLMGLPQDNPDGYKGSSVVGAAKNLKGKLLLIHGAIDDNVSVRNTMRLVQALQDAGKDFELMIYPGSRHGIGSGHYNKLIVDFIRRNLASPKAMDH
ncbi:DPP IV N-terminal domain-containing protein [Paludisphaera borealis]|uniref:Dipeptidyl aminopeptidase 4 n=1 Tax=Paludisphaera borealis TaxID=1387353 RepID=A0A1U7CVN0_9BACT|nr:DPP IV N-terminal domain-containing protein [Paludisphaera borealis]APW63002.1 Dipeptidyl aminopeptidase 4 [Paludisphaera borealis]